MEQAHQIVSSRYPLHGLHSQLVLIHRQVCIAVDGAISCWAGATSLSARGGRDAHFPKLHIEIAHEFAHPLADNAIVLVLQLLGLGRGRAKQGVACVDRSRRSRCFSRSTKKYSCLRRLRARLLRLYFQQAHNSRSWACWLTACIEQSSGVLLSNASPV